MLRSSVSVLALLFLLETSSFAKTPYSAYEMREVETSEESKIRDLRTQEITQIRIALGRRTPTNRRADLYFRLAEIYLEDYRAQFMLEGRVHEKRIEKHIEDKFIDRAHSRPSLYAGIKACQEIIGFRIPFPRMDEIYYFLGFYHSELEDRKSSAHYYLALTQSYPNSRFLGVAYKELGDFASSEAQFQKSSEYYEKALQRSPAERRPPILHKLAWSYYRIRLYDRAVSTMKEAIAGTSQYGDRYLPLKEEALRDIATLMTETGRVEEAIRYFEQVAGDSKTYPKILEKLGRQYERNVELPKAIMVYETLLKTHPESESAFRVRVKLIELDIKQKNLPKALSRLKGLEIYSGGEQETQTAAQNIRVLTRKIAVDHHQTYRKTKSRPDLEIAEGFYTAYVLTFLAKNDPHHEIPEIQMYLAEVKRDLGKSREVADLYKKVLASKDSRYAKDAGLLWTASLIEAMKAAPQSSGAEPSALEKDFIEAADLLNENLGDSKEAKEASLRATQVLAGYRSTRPEAIQRIQKIIANWPKSSQALIAAQLWLQLCLDHKPQPNLEELAQIVKDLRGNSALMENDRAAQHGKLKAALDGQVTRLQVNEIAEKEKKREYTSAARSYEDFAAGTRDRDVAEKSYTNAMGLYLKEMGTSDTSGPILALIATWTKRYPQSPRAIESTRTAATNALIRGKFDLSAQLFEILGNDMRDPDSLETAGRIFEATAERAKAQQCWAGYLVHYGSSPNRWRVALHLARSHEGAGQDADASRAYRYCAASSEVAFQAECNARLADLYIKNRDVAQAKALYKKVADGTSGAGRRTASVRSKRSTPKAVAQRSPKMTGAVSPYVGYARYRLAELTESEASFVPLKFPEAQLQKALAQRLGFLEPLSKAYQSAVQVGGPWGVAALHRLALWATRFADEVDTIEAPSSLQGPSLEKFRRDLKSVSNPLREKAKITWNEAYTKASNSSILSPVLPEIADHLADYKVNFPGRAQGPQGSFQVSGNYIHVTDSDQKAEAFTKVRDRLIKNAQDASAWLDYGNLLWGDEKSLLAKLAFERALGLNRKNPAVLNNLAVVILKSEGQENWVAAAEATQLFEEALQIDDFFIHSKMNLASLLNYYRVFGRAKTLWDQVLVKSPNNPDALDGFGVALQGTGNTTAAAGSFRKAKDQGADSSRFVAIYHEGAKYSVEGVDGADRCVDRMDGLSSGLQGFEARAVEYLKGKCEQWKKKD
jgi:Tfp pilus assembly protein PilF